MQRYFDKNAFVRSKALKVTLRIIREESITLQPFKLYLNMML